MTDFAFVSTGDPDKDRQIADDHIRHDRLIAEGMCPNGHGPMIQDSPNDWHFGQCQFHYAQVSLYVGV